MIAIPASELRGGRQNIWLRVSQVNACATLKHTAIGESQERVAEQRQQEQQKVYSIKSQET